MGKYQDQFDENKRKGQHQTRDGGMVYKNPVQNQTQKAVDAANAQQNSGIYVNRDNGQVQGNQHNHGGGYGSGYSASKNKAPEVKVPSAVKNPAGGYKAPKVAPTKPKAAGAAVDGSRLAAQAYQDRLAAYAAEDEEERDKWRDEAVQAHYDTAGVGQYRTRDGGVVKQDWQGDNPNTGAAGETQNLMKLDTVYNPTAANWQQDAGIQRMLDKFRGGDYSQLYYTDANGNRVALPMQNLNLGDGRYIASALRDWDRPDSEIISDHYGNRMTRGDFKQALAAGLYDRGNRAAYDQWQAGYALPAGARQYNIFANGGQGGWETVGGQGAGGGMNMADAMAAYGGQGAYGGYDPGGMLGSYSAYIDAAVDALLGQKAGIDQSAEAAKQNAYESYLRSKLGMDEQTRGMATGMADSLAVQNDLTFQNNLSAIDRDRMNAYADIDNQAAQMRAEGNLQLAQLAADQEQLAYERAMAEREWAYKLQQDAMNGDGGGGSAYDLDDLIDLHKAGVIDTPTLQSMLGLPGSTMMSATEYIDSNHNRFDFANITPENITIELDALVKGGYMTEDEREKALMYYARQLGYGDLN